MLTTLAQWQRSFVPGGVRFRPPSTPDAGFIQVCTELAPLRSLRAIAEERLSGSGWLTDARLGPLERLTTTEGEPAGLVRVRGRIAGEPAERAFGLVVADDRCLEIESLARDPAHADELYDLVRTLLTAVRLGLGRQRWRRFEYTSPPGWHGRRRGLGAQWYPERFPSELAALTVPPARPTALVMDDDALFADRLLSERSLVVGALAGEIPAPVEDEDAELAPDTTEDIEAGNGLRGTITRLTIRSPELPALACDTAVLGDGAYTYVFRLECRAADRSRYDALLAMVIGSAQPVPDSSAPSAPAALDCWAE